MVNPKEQKQRNIAIMIIGVMVVIWTVLGVMSFVDSGDRVRPHAKETIFSGQNGLYGKQVFQDYNCMDCHTIVGNGAYFAPDLTKIYETSGPAYLLAYLGSPGAYPTEAIVKIQLNELIKAGEIEDVKNMDDYYAKFPQAKTRIEERGGKDALMPNLQFSKDQINGLIAFLKYTSKINTAGWPPEILARPAVIEAEKRHLEAKSGLSVPMAAVTGGSSSDDGTGSLVSVGEKEANDLGCMACHSTDGSVKIGPSWKSLFDHNVKLVGGESVKADEEYLKVSILDPNSQIVDGFLPNLMPSYQDAITDEQIDAIIEYIKSLK